MDHNPYAAPRVELVEAPLPATFLDPRWTPGHLRVMAGLSLAALLADLVLLLASWLAGSQSDTPLAHYIQWLDALCTLLGCFLSWRATGFLVARFAARGLRWPMWLSIGLALIIQGYTLAFDHQLDGAMNVQLLGLMVLFVPSGLVALWYGIVLLRISLAYPSVKVLGWFDTLGGLCLASILLFIPGTLLATAGLLPMALMFLRGAREAAAGEPA
ncbi:MAG: hypothetical protein GAK45_01354 [Pseudomonas citronellolis]|nr:MAG: hypothetical protein GAK45_01354 [Pseudomonas citronellolis]